MNFIKKIYILILYETFILKSSFIVILILFFFFSFLSIANYSYLSSLPFIHTILMYFVWLVIFMIILSIILLPYVFYIPGDNSFMEKMLTKSESPHAKMLKDKKTKF